MRVDNLYQVILAPHTTEKATLLADKLKQHVFRVNKNATKKSIKQAFKVIFAVDAIDVRVKNTPAKNKRFKQKPGVRSGHKIAMVTLAQGQDINLENLDSLDSLKG